MALPFKKILITGGAGFVGSGLAVLFRERFDGLLVAACDNLRRRGSELNLDRLRQNGVEFVHADIRVPDDLDTLPPFDLMIDCSAEPSVHAGMNGSPAYVINTNLTGTLHCLELARKRGAAFLFPSTSRVYPMAGVNSLKFHEAATRFELEERQDIRGATGRGITEDFPLDGARSLYGASKLSAELFISEYASAFGMKALINRCGLLTGPWQMGKVDQGVIALWVARHFYGLPLKYIGYGGTGKQVRDLLHINDLFDLLVAQAGRLDVWDGRYYNIGGGREVSVSLMELTGLCRNITGRTVEIAPVPETSAVDLRIYLTDHSAATRDFGWKPGVTPEAVVIDIHRWIKGNSEKLKSVFA